ncbi:MAG: TolB family protein [Mycobacteriales bacterium]
MTDLESEIRATLAAAAASVPDESAPSSLTAGPADLRARRGLPPRGLPRGRWLAPAAAAAAAALIAGTVGVVAGRHHAPTPGKATPTTQTTAPMTPVPATFVGATKASIVQLSSATGTVEKVLAKTGTALTDNLAISPDGSAVYAAWRVRQSDVIYRISVATGRVQKVGAGWNPAVSPDGRYLAYVSNGGDPFVFVRDLRSGRISKWSLTSVVPGCAELSSVNWLGDDRRLVIQTAHSGGCPKVDRKGNYSLTPAVDTPLRLVTLDPTAKDARPHAVSIFGLPAAFLDGYHVVSGGTAAPSSLLVSYVGNLYRINLDAPHPAAVAFVRMPQSVVFATDRSGTHLLYVHPFKPNAIYRGTIAGRRLTDVRSLPFAPIFEDVAW